MDNKDSMQRMSEGFWLHCLANTKTCMFESADSSEVKDVVHGHMQTQKNDVPQEINEVPIEILDFIPDLFDDTEGMDEATIDSRNPEDKDTT